MTAYSTKFTAALAAVLIAITSMSALVHMPATVAASSIATLA